MPKLHKRCIAGLELAFSRWESKAQAINAQKQPFLTPQKVRKKMAYAKTAPMVHCLAFSMAGPIGAQGASDKRIKTATIETRRKIEKNGLCQNCTNGAGPMEEQDTSDKLTKPAIFDSAECSKKLSEVGRKLLMKTCTYGALQVELVFLHGSSCWKAHFCGPCCVILVQGTCYMSLLNTRIHLEQLLFVQAGNHKVATGPSMEGSRAEER